VDASTSLRNKAVLVVEDDKDVREALSDVLSEAGYRVFTANRAERGLEMLPTLPRPCLILLDNLMPGMDGRGFLLELTEHGDASELPVTLISASDDLGAQGLPGVVAVLRKPFDVEALLEIVATHCR
jgi:two-component system chemotaxis response regulator CheY